MGPSSRTIQSWDDDQSITLQTLIDLGYLRNYCLEYIPFADLCAYCNKLKSMSLGKKRVKYWGLVIVKTDQVSRAGCTKLCMHIDMQSSCKVHAPNLFELLFA
jgi:hypothetical protein